MKRHLTTSIQFGLYLIYERTPIFVDFDALSVKLLFTMREAVFDNFDSTQRKNALFAKSNFMDKINI